MIINTRLFGNVELSDEKILHFPGGIIGFPELQDFALIHDEDQGEGAGIRYLQCIQEPGFAMPVIDPLRIKPDYNPLVEDELLKRLGDYDVNELLVLTTITVPSDLSKMSVNLKAPFVINAGNRQACQIIVEDYEVKYPIYELLQSMKKAGG